MTAPIAELPQDFRPLLRTEYDRLIELGVFDELRIELVGGVLVEMRPHSQEHVGLIVLINRLLMDQAGDVYAIGVQTPVVTDAISEPQPDFSVLPMRDYRTGDKPQVVLLVIEISNSTLRFDLGEKARRYAMAGYPEYWVVDIDQRLVHVHRDPNPDGTWGSVAPQADGTIQAVAVTTVSVDLGWVFDR